MSAPMAGAASAPASTPVSASTHGGVDDWVDEPARVHSPLVTVLLDAGDDAAVTEVLLAAHSPAAGRVTVHPTPAAGGANSLAYDVLAALGRPVRRLAQEKISGGVPAWQAVAAWVHADQITQVVVLRAHRLTRPGWERLAQLRARTGIDLILVWHEAGLSPAAAAVLDDVGHRVVTDPTEIVGAAVPGSAADEAAEDPARASELDAVSGPVSGCGGGDLPPLPDGDFTSFRAEAYRQLGVEQFAQVDAVYQRGMHAACRWLSGHPEQRKVAGQLGEDHYLTRLFPTALNVDEATLGVALLTDRYPTHTLRALAGGLLCVGRGSQVRAWPLRFADETDLQVFLGELVVDTPTRRHSIARLRGAQAGALLHGLLLNLPAELPRLGGPGLSAPPFEADTAERIRARIASPVHAAALAAALFTGCVPTDLAEVPIKALSDDAAHITMPGRGGPNTAKHAVFVVPEPARPIMAAARAFLTLRGTPAHRWLLSPGIGKDLATLQASSKAAGLALPVTDQSLARSWQVRVTAWWVGHPVHHSGENP